MGFFVPQPRHTVFDIISIFESENFEYDTVRNRRMISKFKYYLPLFVIIIHLTGLSQHESAVKFFSPVPQLISAYPSPGSPCNNAIEFTINTHGKNTINLEADVASDVKGKSKVNVSKSGNSTIWYKLVFQTDCELNFRIYSDKAEDIYHYFVYLQDGSADFCRKLSQNEVTPIRANMLDHKEGIIGTGLTDGIKINYRDTTEFYFRRILLHTPFLDGIRGKAGETYYINIYHMGGTDDFHYLVMSACYREMNLKTGNDNAGKKAEIIEKLPEHVTKPVAEKSQAEKDSLAALEKSAEAKKKAEKNAAEKAKAEAAEKKIAEGMAKMKAAEEAKKKSAIKKISPQLVSMDEKDTLNQYIIEGEIIFATDPAGPVVQAEIYLSNADGSIIILKKMYTNEKGLFRFANLPGEPSYLLSMNIADPALAGKEPRVNGKLTLKGQPAGGVVINNTVKTADDGSFVLTSKELFSINVNDLFNRWSVDLTNPDVYNEVLKKYGGISFEGLVYRVQIGAYREEQNFNYQFMEDLGKVEKQSLPDGITRFVMGEFKTLKEADAFKQKAFERKVNDAFILAYFNGSKRFLEELIEKNMLEKQ